MTKELPGWSQRELNEMGTSLVRIMQGMPPKRFKECPNCSREYVNRPHKYYCSEKCRLQFAKQKRTEFDSEVKREIEELRHRIAALQRKIERGES